MLLRWSSKLGVLSKEAIARHVQGPCIFRTRHAIFKTFISLLGFQRRKLQICKAAHEIMPKSGMENPMCCLCDMRRPCADEGGADPATGGAKLPRLHA